MSASKFSPDMMPDFADIITAMANAAAGAILPHFRPTASAISAENKGGGSTAQTGYDPVTAADVASETAMRAVLANLRPDDAIVGEEIANREGTSGWTWVLDPIDGTRAFVAGTTSWGVLIAAVYDGKPMQGAIFQPYNGDLWVKAFAATQHIAADKNHGQKNQDCKVNSAANPDDFILATTDPYLFDEKAQKAFGQLRARAKITRYGLDCTAYAHLAHGGIGLVIENGLKSFDVAALIPVVEGAGGLITDWAGRPIEPLSPSWDGSVIAAANQSLLDLALAYMGANSEG